MKIGTEAQPAVRGNADSALEAEVAAWTGKIVDLEIQGSTEVDFPVLAIRFQEEMPASVIEQLCKHEIASLGKDRVLWVDHELFRGLCRLYSKPKDSPDKIECRDARAWLSQGNAAQDRGSVAWKLVRPDANSSNPFLAPVDADGGSESTAFVVPQLVAHMRASIFSADAVDTVNQTFRADTYCELRLRQISRATEQSHVAEFLSILNITSNKIDFVNVSEYIGDVETWCDSVPGTLGMYDYCFKIRAKAVINESMELKRFPCDIQELNITITFNAPCKFVAMVPNDEFPSVFQSASFQLWDVFDLPLNDVVLTLAEKSKKEESSAGYEYSRCIFRTYLRRHANYYISNVAMPMGILTLLAALSCGIEPDGQSLGTADRLSVTLTLVLTGVAYKFVVASSLPQVSYLTMLDQYVLVCFAFMVIAALENVVFPAYQSRAVSDGTPEEELVQEVVIVIVFLVVFVGINLVWGAYVWAQVRRNDQALRDLLTLERIRRVAARRAGAWGDIGTGMSLADRQGLARKLVDISVNYCGQGVRHLHGDQTNMLRRVTGGRAAGDGGRKVRGLGLEAVEVLVDRANDALARGS